MKKLLIAMMIVAFAFAFSSSAMAAKEPSELSINFVKKLGVGQTATNPTTEIRLIRYGRCGTNGVANTAGLVSGDVVVWDTTSADAFTISACTTSCDSKVAGVLVTDLATPDSGYLGYPGQGNWGYMAVSGPCIVKVQGAITAGDKLMASAPGPYGTATKMSSDPSMVGDGAGNGAGAAYWGILGTALEANSSGNGYIRAIIQTE